MIFYTTIASRQLTATMQRMKLQFLSTRRIRVTNGKKKTYRASFWVHVRSLIGHFVRVSEQLIQRQSHWFEACCFRQRNEWMCKSFSPTDASDQSANSIEQIISKSLEEITFTVTFHIKSSSIERTLNATESRTQADTANAMKLALMTALSRTCGRMTNYHRR